MIGWLSVMNEIKIVLEKSCWKNKLSMVIVYSISVKVDRTHMPQSLTLKQKSTCRCRKVMYIKRRRLYKTLHYMIWTLPMPDHRYQRLLIDQSINQS